ncbi:MAG: dihydroorotase [Opitutales bacterium]|nr:dihydroorotase [Opitutales bacterium]
MLWIQNGRVIDPANDRDANGDIYAVDGMIVDQLSDVQKAAAEIIDAKGLVVSPGFVDIHVHFREPGQTHKETIATGSRAAAAGGFTSVVCMPNTSPAADNPGTIQRIKDSAARNSVVHLYTTGTITVGRQGKELAPIGSLNQAGVVAITDDGDCVQSNALMRRAAEYATMFDLPLMDHCQDSSMTEGSVMNEGLMSLKLGLKGWPSAAEDIIVSRNVIISRQTGAKIHMQHISSAESVEILREAKAAGIAVSGEATPHHLYFTDDNLENYDTHFKMNPPLRSKRDQEALIAGLLDGTIDCIATDHAPHTDYEKDCEFDYAPFGILGLETALAASLEVLYHSGKTDLKTFLGWMTHKPCALVKLPRETGTLRAGCVADITLFDPNEAWTVGDTFQSKSKNSPWIGMTLRGKVKRTIVAGETVWDGAQIVNRDSGKC